MAKFIFCLFVVFFMQVASAMADGKRDRTPLILLKSIQDHNNIDIKNWSMSEKLDGVRAYWDGHALYSRSGKIFAAPAWFIQDLPDFELDGELWTQRGDFEHIVSIVNQQKAHEGWKKISYQIFEVPNAPGNFSQRLSQVNNYLQNHPSSFVKVIPQHICSGETHLKSFLAEIELLGGEGVVVRNPEMLYHTGRSSSSLKVKSFQDADCKVTGYKEGKGKFKGLTGAIFCQRDSTHIITQQLSVSYFHRQIS